MTSLTRRQCNFLGFFCIISWDDRTDWRYSWKYKGMYFRLIYANIFKTIRCEKWTTWNLMKIACPDNEENGIILMYGGILEFKSLIISILNFFKWLILYLYKQWYFVKQFFFLLCLTHTVEPGCLFFIQREHPMLKYLHIANLYWVLEKISSNNSKMQSIYPYKSKIKIVFLSKLV